MTQSIIIQAGQCGNQIGWRFWDLILREHTHVNTDGCFDDALENFFYIPNDCKLAAKEPCWKHLKARAVLVDMEEGVISQLLKSPLRSIFDTTQTVTDVSGSGNNWAVGYHDYGSRYKDSILDLLRKEAERCDCLQCFFLMHSLGGGTGSGLGTAILEMLQEEFPGVYRFTTSVYPSAQDDVITSPYNTLLANRKLTEFADCVLPIENQALFDILKQVDRALLPGQSARKKVLSSGRRVIRPSSAITSSEGSLSGRGARENPFDKMNNIIANVLLNLTSSARFSGALNVDLNEIVMNLVPLPRLHYLVSSIAPLYSLLDINIPPRRVDQMFYEAFSPHNQLISADPRTGVYLACTLLSRGQVKISDIQRNIERLNKRITFIPWNCNSWKIGHCNVPPKNQPYSLLTLVNNTCLAKTFAKTKERFKGLYRKKAHLHHLLRVTGMETQEFEDSLNSINNLISEYVELEAFARNPPPLLPRIQSEL